MKLSKKVFAVISLCTLALCGCQAQKPTAPNPEDIIVTVGDIQIPYSLYKHYYQAALLQENHEAGKGWSGEQLETLSLNTEALILNDCVDRLIAEQQNVSLSEEELSAIAGQIHTAIQNKQYPVGTDELLNFRFTSQALKEKTYTALYEPDFHQSAVHVQSLFLPYLNDTDEEKAGKDQLITITGKLCSNEKDLSSLCDPLVSSYDAVLNDIYLTNGDMGQGVYELAATLEPYGASQAFTLGSDGVYLLQRLPVDEEYVNANIGELLQNSTEFSNLYRMFQAATRKGTSITYTEAKKQISPDILSDQ